MAMILAPKHIRDIRKKSGMSQAAFAKQLGVSQACVASWELGIRHPKYAVLLKLSRIYERLNGVA